MIRICFALLISIIPCSTFSQNLEGKKTLRPPAIYSKPIGTIGKTAERRDDKEKYWLVFSDRENNSYYPDQNLTPGKELGKLDFLEACFVSQETDLAVKLVRAQLDPPSIDTKEKNAVFTKTAVELGWVDKSKLLLWKYSLIDPKSNYSEKAVTVTKLEQITNLSSYLRDGLIDLYNTPKKTSNAKANSELKMFQYLFIYKKENNMYLVGKNNQVNHGDVTDVILGWTPKEQVYYWENALCLRVNFDQNEEETRKKLNIPVSFFQNPEDAKKFQNGDKKVTGLPFKYQDPTLEENRKDNPYLYGYPILSKDNELESGIYKTGYITNTIDNKGNSIFNVLDQAVLDQKNASGEDDFEHVNMFFVFDGSNRSMLATFASTIEANAALGSDKKENNNKYSWNGLIYNSNNCDQPIELLETTFTNDKEDFINSLRIASQKTLTPPCIINRDQDGSPLFDAIVKACNSFPKATNSNVLIITGTSTDKDKSKITEVQNAMIKKSVNTFFVQLHDGNGSLYDNYKTDIKNLVIGTSLSIDNNAMKGFTGTDKKFDSANWKQYGESYNLINSAILGTFYSRDNKPFTSKELGKYFGDFLRKNDNRISEAKNRYKNTNKVDAIAPKSSEDQSSDKTFYYYLKNNCKMTDEEIRKMNDKNNYQLFIEAYTTISHNGLKEPFFNKSLFLSKDEFDRLMISLQKLSYGSLSTEEKRTKILDAYKQIIINYKGGYVDDKDNNMSLQSFWDLITGMPSKNPLFKNYTIMDVQDERHVKNEQLDLISGGFNTIYKRLKAIKSGKNYSKIDIGDQEFYWVTEDTFILD